MRYNKEELYNCVITELDRQFINYRIHNFDSGSIMIDVRYSNSFYVLQLEETLAGFSEIRGENVAFDLIPDVIFNDNEMFIVGLKEMLKLE